MTATRSYFIARTWGGKINTIQVL